MELLKQRILTEGSVRPGGVLKVDSFLNHQIDPILMDQIAEEFCRRFRDVRIDRILTMESSGISVAYAVARQLGVPMVVARKRPSVNLDGEAHTAEVASAPGEPTGTVIVSKKYLSEGEHVLLVDDILANGFSMQALISLADAAGASVEGIGIVIEKAFQEGGHRLRNLGFRLESLTVIESMDETTGQIRFRNEN